MNRNLKKKLKSTCAYLPLDSFQKELRAKAVCGLQSPHATHRTFSVNNGAINHFNTTDLKNYEVPETSRFITMFLQSSMITFLSNLEITTMTLIELFNLIEPINVTFFLKY